MEKPAKGFIPVMLTPFKQNGEIDYLTLSKLTEYYIEAGAAGLFANCLSSEMFQLSDSERFLSIKCVMDAANGKIPVVATGTFGGSLYSQADFVKKIYDLGLSAVIGITSILAKQTDTDEVFKENVFSLFELTDKIPFGFYECPVPYKRILSPNLMFDLVKTERVVYYKDTCLDIKQVQQKIELSKEHAFGLYDAYMVHAVESLNAGAAGLSCIQGNFFPELVVWLCKNHESLTDEIRQVQQFFIENMDVMHEVYPTNAKYFLSKSGFPISTFTRRNDIGEFTSKIINQMDELRKNYEKLCESIGLN